MDMLEKGFIMRYIRNEKLKTIVRIISTIVIVGIAVYAIVYYFQHDYLTQMQFCKWCFKTCDVPLMVAFIGYIWGMKNE